ncbi:secretion pathway protein Sls2/Rcy1 [Ophiocordyceps camponoti-floridani]|uniref:Secretion pathway protein Sls2/Rcy1 n=1 Tax=Ophiocordyceps camponoti-floridani TaxID=2030778 RepID=A0A8H4VCN3_9HYPO|nr:secretion pathway protein Sls2/Rcy1 [Ophiocordyceps camponoti-floridani]
MHRSRKGGAARGAGILSALQATEMTDSRCKLPAEMLAAILDYLPVADQLRAARASRLLQEMVYDDTRWVARLKSMGCWDEREARRRFDESVRRRRETGQQAANGAVTLFDASAGPKQPATEALRDGFETMSLGGAPKNNTNKDDAESYLGVLAGVRSIRGGARQEYGKVYGALAPFYYDVVKARSHAEPIVFKAFRDPEQQAQMLANLRRFARSDWASGCVERENRLAVMTSIFEAAVVREFEQGYDSWDVDGRMRRYGHVLHTLNGARVAVELFVHKHPIFHDRDLAAFNPIDCLDRRGEAGVGGTAAVDILSLESSRRFFDALLVKVNEQADVVGRIFPDSEAVFCELVDRVREELVMEYVTPLLDECHARSIAVYLKAVSGLFEQTARFFRGLAPPSKMATTSEETVKELLLKVFEPHLDLFFQDELEFFTKQAELEVSQWEKKLSEHDSSVESFFMSNINRSADKKDFLSSFKKVVMLPVAVLPSFPTLKTTSSPSPSLPTTPRAGSPMPTTLGSTSSNSKTAPTDELAAKAAIMASKLEGIKSLCSIEVALHLVHMAKASLGRVAPMIALGGQMGGEARELCANIFVILLRILGQRHVKTGFDTAVGHLSNYRPRQRKKKGDVDEDDDNDEDDEDDDGSQKEAKPKKRNGGVAPLVTFIELVNVGDLISQMIDVFYEQQLATPSIADRNDFLDPAGLAKKKFEQMLDESVAAGLNKGIDVLMDEVEFLLATTQLPTDYNPPTTSTTTLSPSPSSSSSIKTDSSLPIPPPQSSTNTLTQDMGPTATAHQIVTLVTHHTSMLAGTTDKAMLDVFNGEVGLRLFASLCKHLKRQRISVPGAVPLIADMRLYADLVQRRLRNPLLLPYFAALRELSQIFLVDARHARDLAAVIADSDRFAGVFRAEEVYEYAQRRADWYQVRRSVEKAMYGMECCLM